MTLNHYFEMSLRFIVSLSLFILFAISFGEFDSSNNHSSMENSTVINSGKVTESIRDIAYYLRAHKFNEYDRRYETDPERAERRYFKEFPRPPLRSLHWEVHKYCEPSFYECVDYLSKKIKYTSSKRVDDTVVVMKEQRWHFPNHSLQIMQVDEECRKQRRIDDRIADPFEGPLERFQWRVTASYFMCWYTIRRMLELEHLEESCDNFANCLDIDFGPNNHDSRADDSESYSCALYSFCPDPCCPFKHITEKESCWESPDNPCHRMNKKDQRNCAFNSSQNIDFSDIILNRWNVSCGCPHHGYEWNSRYGICRDLDECVSKTHNCRNASEACVNLAGSFRCACKWGDIWNEKLMKCMPSSALTLIKLGRAKEVTKGNESIGIVAKIKRFLFRRNSANNIFHKASLETPILISIIINITCVFARYFTIIMNR